MTTCLLSTSVAYHLPAKIIYFWGSTGMEITGSRTANWTCDWLCTSGTLQTSLPTVNTLVPSDFHHFWSFASTKQAVTWHQTLDTNCFCVRMQAVSPGVSYAEMPAVTMWRSGKYHLLQCAMYTPRLAEDTWHQSVCYPTFYIPL
jgi:hypothetical protein